MRLLGLSLGETATAAVMLDGRVVACVSEERFSGVKRDSSFPRKAIEYCLSAAKLSPERLDAVAVGGAGELPSDFGIETTRVPRAAALGAYAYWSSPLRGKDTGVLLLDSGVGAALSTVLRFGLIPLVGIPPERFPPTTIMREATALLGLPPGDHDPLVMSLAARAPARQWRGVYDALSKAVTLDGSEFRSTSASFEPLLRKFLKEGAAGGAQRFCEDLVARWVAKTMKNNRLSHLAVSGSLSMNHRVMARIAALKEIEGLWVPPDSGDGALALGACFHLATIRFGKTPEPLTDAGLGPDAGTAGLDGFELVENPSAELVAGLLADGAVIARCAGRAEFGSRALGNRSILADPRNAKAVPFIAAKIKRRDSQASFSPTILAEAAPRYLKNPKKIPSPFMTLAFQATPRARKDLAAAVDAEGLVRPQVLAPAANPDFALLIKAFGKKTGVPALLNTSFNEHGKPMALTAPDAVRAFKDSSLDYLLLGRVLVGRRA